MNTITWLFIALIWGYGISLWFSNRQRKAEYKEDQELRALQVGGIWTRERFRNKIIMENERVYLEYAYRCAVAGQQPDLDIIEKHRASTLKQMEQRGL